MEILKMAAWVVVGWFTGNLVIFLFFVALAALSCVAGGLMEEAKKTCGGDERASRAAKIVGELAGIVDLLAWTECLVCIFWICVR